MILDGELKNILVQIMEGQTRLESKINTRFESLEGEVRRNSIKLESIDEKIGIVAEVQTAHKAQNEKAFNNSDILLEERADLIETAAKSISKDLRNVYDSVEVLKDMTGKHEVDINILKRRPV